MSEQPAEQPQPLPSSTARLGLAQRVREGGVSYAIIAACIIVYLAQTAAGLNQTTNGLVQDPVTLASVFYGPLALHEPWRFITSLFVHASPLHILSNMFSLFMLGPGIERLIGHWRFAVLYFLSGIGGGVAVLLLLPNTPALGASGAIFGLLGAYFIIARRLGGNITQIVVIIGINLAIGFYVPSIAWQAHVGGLIVGAIVALIYLVPRTARQPNRQQYLLVGLFGVLLAVTLVRGILY